MRTSRLFWKLFLTCAGLNLIAAIVLGIILSNWLQTYAIEQIDHRLRDAASLARSELAGLMAGGPSESLEERTRELGEQTASRITLIAPDGTVLADNDRASLNDVRAMENHHDRPEVAKALALGTGASTRLSSTLGTQHRYFALRLGSDKEPTGFIRVALPTATVDAEAAILKRWVWGLVAATSLAVLALSAWIIQQMVGPVATLSEAAEAIAAGDYSRRLYVASRDELGTLARTFNRLREELNTRTTQFSETGERQATVLGGMIEGVIAVDSRQRVVLANEAAGRLFAFQPSAAEGRPLLEIVRNHAVSAAVTTAMDKREAARLETKSSAQVGDSSDAGRAAFGAQHINVHVQPLPGSPCPGVVLVIHDTTELRRLEALRRDFMANVSHELKTPLSSIKAYTETLRNGALNDPDNSQRFLQRIEEQADRLHHLIIDMLMLARLESEQQAFEITAVNVPDVVTGCIRDHRTAAEAKQIELASSTSAEADSPCVVRADREGLREILDNLVNNAIKYTPERGNVTIDWQRNGSTARISVRDTGIGIKAKDQPRVFERFYRVDKARSREMGGTGLGLSIVKHLVQSFGGKVSVESEPGKGSTFTIELPVSG